MAAIPCVYTITRAAMMLGITEELLDALADTLEPEDGVLWIYDSTENPGHGIYGFNDLGLDNVREMLDDPAIMDCFLPNQSSVPAEGSRKDSCASWISRRSRPRHFGDRQEQWFI
jgi:hypothetical protein